MQYSESRYSLALGLSPSPAYVQLASLPDYFCTQTHVLAQAAYLLMPASKAPAHTVAAGAHGLEVAHKPASSEGGAIRGEKFTGGSGKGPAKESAEPMTDDEGEEASGEAVGASMSQGFVCSNHL